MDDRPRFYFDVHVPIPVMRALQRRGIDVVLGQERLGDLAADEAHLTEAITEARVVVSKDADFCRLHASGINHCGIVFVRTSASIGAMIEGIVRIAEQNTAAGMNGRLEFL